MHLKAYKNIKKECRKNKKIYKKTLHSRLNLELKLFISFFALMKKKQLLTECQ